MKALATSSRIRSRVSSYPKTDSDFFLWYKAWMHFEQQRISVRILMWMCALGCASVAWGQALPWSLKGDETGIPIFQRDMPNSPLVEVKGRVLINAPLVQVVSLIGDSAHWIDWMPRTKEAKLIAKEKQGIVFYTRFRGVGPIWDRDVYLWMSPLCVKSSRGESSPFQVEVRFTTEHPFVKKYPDTKDSVIRMVSMIGSWKVWSAELPTKTYVEYQAYVDAGGELPDVFKNMAARTLVKRVLRNLRKQAPKHTARYEQLKQDAPQLFPHCLSVE